MPDTKALLGKLLYIVWALLVLELFFTQGIASLYLPTGKGVFGNISVWFSLFALSSLGYFLLAKVKRWRHASIILTGLLTTYWTCFVFSQVPGKTSIIPHELLIKIIVGQLPIIFIWGSSLGWGQMVYRSLMKQTAPIIQVVVLGFTLWLIVFEILWLSGVHVLLAGLVTSLVGYGLLLAHVHMVQKEKDERLTVRPFSNLEVFVFMSSVFLLTSFQIYVIRPFPVGWDEIHLYMDTARAIGETGKAPLGLGMSLWSAFTGLGYALGGATSSFVFSISPSILLIPYFGYVLTRFGKDTKKMAFGYLLGIVFLAIPMIQFTLTRDLKVDVALSLFGLGAISCLPDLVDPKKTKNYSLHLVMLGIFLGISLAIKLTALYLIFAVIGVVVFLHFSFWGALLYALVFLLVGGLLGLLKYLYIDIESGDTLWHVLLGVLSLMLCMKISFSKEILGKVCRSGTIVIVTLLLVTTPWIVKNTQQALNRDQNVSVRTIFEGIDAQGFYPKWIPSTQQQTTTQNNEKKLSPSAGKKKPLLRCGTIEVNEDLAKFSSSQCGFIPFVESIFYSNFELPHLSQLFLFTPIFLILLGYLLLVGPAAKQSIIWMFVGSGFLLAPLFPLLKSFGEPLFPFGYLLVLAFFCCFAKSLLAQGSHQILCVFVGLYGFIYALSGQFVPWYGIFLFIGILVLVGEKFQKNENNSITLFHGCMLIGVVLLYAWGGGLLNLEKTRFIDYKAGKRGAAQSFHQVFPELVEPLIRLNLKESYQLNPDNQLILWPTPAAKSTAKVYLVGTFMGYFISDNATRVYTDDLLLNFSRLDLNPYTSNVDFIVLDINTGTTDTTQNSSLQKRYEDALTRLKNEGVQLVETDNICLWLAFHDDSLTQEEFLLLSTTEYDSMINGQFHPADVKKNVCTFMITQKNDLLEELPESLSFVSKMQGKKNFHTALMKDITSSYYALFQLK